MIHNWESSFHEGSSSTTSPSKSLIATPLAPIPSSPQPGATFDCDGGANLRRTARFGCGGGKSWECFPVRLWTTDLKLAGSVSMYWVLTITTLTGSLPIFLPSAADMTSYLLMCLCSNCNNVCFSVWMTNECWFIWYEQRLGTGTIYAWGSDQKMDFVLKEF